MSRGILIVALIFSLGLNLGLLIRAFSPQGPVSETVTEPAEEAPVDRTSLSEGRSRGRRGHGLNARRIADELGLEGEARRRFREIRRDFFEQTRDHRSRVSGLQQELRDLLSQPEIDRERVSQTVEALGAAHRGLEGLFVDRYLATLEILDAGQQEIYRRHVLDRVVGRGAGSFGLDP